MWYKRAFTNNKIIVKKPKLWIVWQTLFSFCSHCMNHNPSMIDFMKESKLLTWDTCNLLGHLQPIRSSNGALKSVSALCLCAWAQCKDKLVLAGQLRTLALVILVCTMKKFKVRRKLYHDESGSEDFEKLYFIKIYMLALLTKNKLNAQLSQKFDHVGHQLKLGKHDM